MCKKMCWKNTWLLHISFIIHEAMIAGPPKLINMDCHRNLHLNCIYIVITTFSIQTCLKVKYINEQEWACNPTCVCVRVCLAQINQWQPAPENCAPACSVSLRSTVLCPLICEQFFLAVQNHHHYNNPHNYDHIIVRMISVAGHEG